MLEKSSWSSSGGFLSGRNRGEIDKKTGVENHQIYQKWAFLAHF
jgi:hypothetical protein